MARENLKHPCADDEDLKYPRADDEDLIADLNVELGASVLSGLMGTWHVKGQATRAAGMGESEARNGHKSSDHCAKDIEQTDPPTESMATIVRRICKSCEGEVEPDMSPRYKDGRYVVWGRSLNQRLCTKPECRAVKGSGSYLPKDMVMPRISGIALSAMLRKAVESTFFIEISGEVSAQSVSTDTGNGA